MIAGGRGYLLSMAWAAAPTLRSLSPAAVTGAGWRSGARGCVPVANSTSGCLVCGCTTHARTLSSACMVDICCYVLVQAHQASCVVHQASFTCPCTSCQLLLRCGTGVQQPQPYSPWKGPCMSCVAAVCCVCWLRATWHTTHTAASTAGKTNTDARAAAGVRPQQCAAVCAKNSTGCMQSGFYSCVDGGVDAAFLLSSCGAILRCKACSGNEVPNEGVQCNMLM